MTKMTLGFCLKHDLCCGGMQGSRPCKGLHAVQEVSDVFIPRDAPVPAVS